LVAGCTLGVGLTPPAAAVTDDEFNALKNMVQQLGEKVQKLEQTHDQDQKTHEQDQQQIQRLKEQVGETRKTATDAQQKAEAAAQVQPTRPMPGEGNATHNFTMVGDAEIQFGKTDGQHSGFAMADFAPIFLFRARDNVLFEAGFDIKLQNSAVPLVDKFGTPMISSALP
jgi:TolA-binding protein